MRWARSPKKFKIWKSSPRKISSATNQWAGVQETVQGNSDKTVAVTKEIADRMAEEIRLFSEFMKR